MGAQFVVTPWRDSRELLEVRACLFRKDGDVDRREQAVNKIFAWRLRKHQIPLLLESTADIIDVMLQEEKHGLEHNALRLLYATAVSRFITGLSDSLTDLTRMRPSFFSPGQTLTLPPSLLETRHCIVHRQLPSLATLKSAARQSLEWLWEWYWSHLDTAISHAQGLLSSSSQPRTSSLEVQTELQALLKRYLRSRKAEIKTRHESRPSPAAQTALTTYTTLLSTSPQACMHETLLALLLTAKAILPSDKKLAATMSGAFLLWSPLLALLCSSLPPPLTNPLITNLTQALRARSPFGIPTEEDPVKEGMHAWLVRITTHADFGAVRARAGDGREENFVQDVLGRLFLEPGYWNLRAVEDILGAFGELPARRAWVSVLEAARGDDGGGEVESEGEHRDHSMMTVVADEVNIEEQVQGELEAEAEGMQVRGGRRVKESGLRKRVGMWRPTHIGVLPVGWEDDE